MGVVAVVVAIGTWRFLAMLAQGYAGEQPGVPAGIPRLLHMAVRHLIRSWPQFLTAPLIDGLLLRRLWQSSKARWLTHAAIGWGLVGLMAMSAVAALADHVLRPLGLGDAFVSVALNKDHPVMALTNEVFGLVVLGGILGASLRRFLRREHLPPTERSDIIVLLLIFLIVVSGYPVEAARILMESVPASQGHYSFVGLAIARLLAPLGFPWAVLHFWLFQIHVLASVALLVYWPFGKMMHVFAGPLVAALGAAREQATR